MSKKRRLLILIAPLLIVLALYAVAPHLAANGNKSRLQLFVYPFVLVALGQYLIVNLRVPAALFVGAALCTASGIMYTTMHPFQGSRPGIVVARLHGDELQNETRIFREGLNKTLSQTSNYYATSIADSFEDYKAADAFLGEKGKLAMLISGDKRWLNVFFRHRAPLELKELNPGVNLQSIASMKLHYNVRAIGLSFQENQQTITFVANLIDGVSRRLDGSDLDKAELAFKSAAGQESRWTSFAHRAYPLWALGNMYLESAIRNGTFNKRELECAIRSYRSALEFLRTGDNLDLRASIFNNLAVAHVVRGYYAGKRKDLKTAKTLLMSVGGIYQEETRVPFDAAPALIALENLGYIDSPRAALHLTGKKEFKKLKPKKLRAKQKRAAKMKKLKKKGKSEKSSAGSRKRSGMDGAGKMIRQRNSKKGGNHGG